MQYQMKQSAILAAGLLAGIFAFGQNKKTTHVPLQEIMGKSARRTTQILKADPFFGSDTTTLLKVTGGKRRLTLEHDSVPFIQDEISQDIEAQNNVTYHIHETKRYNFERDTAFPKRFTNVVVEESENLRIDVTQDMYDATKGEMRTHDAGGMTISMTGLSGAKAQFKTAQRGGIWLNPPPPKADSPDKIREVYGAWWVKNLGDLFQQINPAGDKLLGVQRSLQDMRQVFHMVNPSAPLILQHANF